MGKTLLQMTYFASWALISEALLQHFIKLSAYIIIKAKWEMEKDCFKPFTSNWRQLLLSQTQVLMNVSPTGEPKDFITPKHTSPLNKTIYYLFFRS